MVVWWLCWHRTILIRNITQKQYSQFPPVHDFRKPRWGVACVPCMTNLRALYAWVIRWHVTCMLSLARHWQGRRALSNHVCAHSVISMWHVVCLQHLARDLELAVSNLGQPLFCLSITWSRCRNAYRDLWIMTGTPQWARGQFTRTLLYQTGSKNGVIWNSDTGVKCVVPQNYDVCPLLMMHKTCSINYGHLADLQKTLPTTDLNQKKNLSFDKISPRDFYFFPFFSICTCFI